MTGETFAIPAVSAIIERTENGQRQILLQRRQKPGGGSANGLLEVVGGKIRTYENIFDALRREVEEETGLTVTEIQGEAQAVLATVGGVAVLSFTPFCVTQNLCGLYSLVMQTFLCRAEGTPLPRTDEAEEIRWAPAEDVLALLETRPEDFFPLDVLPLRQYLTGLAAAR